MKNLTLAIALACSVVAAFNASAQIPDPNHTVVRFDVFTGGTNFGKIDIELFDQEKPETVRNFLLYIYGGGYSNLVLHRLVPNFVVQAGHVRVDEPASTNRFTNFTAVADFGKITNEYSVGPEFTNDYGTIAMARIGGQTNSATTDWFINLTNNPHLNTVDGGFTVFGRVINTMDDRSGTNLLNYFNTFTSSRLANQTVSGENMNSLPVTTNRTAPTYENLFTVQPTVIQGMPDDAIAPTLTILQPADTDVIVTMDASMIFSGTAADNQAIWRVLYDTLFGESLIASGTENWTIDVPLSVGTNRISVRSVDYHGNVSTIAERVIVREERPIDPNHTIVRFGIFNNGTNFGNLDIELYDDLRPETVRNFLMYVYGGAYSNLVLHTLFPAQVLQAGRARADDAIGFSNLDYTRNFNFGDIATNEYAVGQVLRNEFGTIATARVPGRANSTSNEWHINLTNNPAFDVSSGGSTVFGRVVNSTNDRSGQNLLNYFNTFRQGVNIRQAGFPNETSFNVPVTIARTGFPFTADMFLVQASIIQGGTPRDNVAPIVQINQPAETSVIITTNPSISLAGTASDNQAIVRVMYDGPSGDAIPVTGKENWTAEVALFSGTNRITVRAVDNFGNFHAVERTVFLSHPQRVNFRIVGKGKVTGITDGQEFLVGVNYTFVAKPAARQYFLGWRDADDNFVAYDRTLNFAMPEGLTNLSAVFSKTLLGITNGAYKGLFFPGTNGPLRSSGAISINVSPNGFYSGRLAPLGANYTIRGKFNTNGFTQITGQRGVETLVLQLQFSTTDTVSGTYFDHTHSVSSVGLWAVRKFSTANPTPLAGTYSFLISPTLDTQTAVVGGYGFGNAIIDPLGRITMEGTLANGVVIDQKSSLLAEDVWALVASTKGARESILSAVGFTTNHLFDSDLKWFSSGFPGKTNQNARLSGSLYVPPSQARLFNWTNGVLTLSGGGLPAAIFADVELNEDGSFTIPNNPNNIQFNLPDAVGGLTGSFTHPTSSALTPLQGAVLQSSNMAAGFFLGGTSSGAFTIRAR